MTRVPRSPGSDPEARIGDVSLTSALTALHVLGLLLLWVGYFGPWVQHRAAALTIIGFDLAEIVTFLPGVRDGTLAVGRLHFLAPFGLALVLTAAFAWRLGGWRRGALTALAALGALLLLPGYPFILFWRDDPEVQAQLVLVAAALLGIAATGVLARYWKRGLSLVGLTAAAGGLAVAGWALLQVRPPLAELYGAPPTFGWGWVAMEAGFGLEFVLNQVSCLTVKNGRGRMTATAGVVQW